LDGISDLRICVIGLGYVGLPLAVALARQFRVTGFDLNQTRIAELARGHDRTAEVDELVLAHSPLTLTAHSAECRGAHVYIVTVPTPVDADNRPDLGPLVAASRTVAGLLDPEQRPIIVYESTVYPGVTEEVCGPIVEEASGLVRGRDFFLGYSPERINPGDKEHTVDRIIKVVAGENDDVTGMLAKIYGAITGAGTFRAASIKAAEAAKVIENAQRDINIAFMNEITQIFARQNISVWDVLDAASTKWNFLKFQPGLVGGHCIGVDPYYLSHRAQQLGHDPQVILSGRSINDGMGSWVGDQLNALCAGKSAEVLVMGLTFKEDVPDLRNSKVIDTIRRLEQLGHRVTVHDALADPDEAKHEYGVTLDPDALQRDYDLVLAAVAHSEYRSMAAEEIQRLVRPGGSVADLKAIWRRLELDPSILRWSL